MRVLYVAPRFHTNQVPVVRGWLRNGHQVMFVSQFAGKSEDYADLEPVVLGYSGLFDLCMFLHKWLICHGHRTEKQEFDIRIKAGFPPFLKMAHIIRTFRPNLVIMRERSLYNIPVYLICRLSHIKGILYNQSPLWDHKERDKGLGHRVLISLLPKQRMTPVYGDPNAENAVKMKNSYFVPFVAEPYIERTVDSYCKNGVVRLLCIGRYEERKRLFMLVEAVKEFLLEGAATLVIAGEAVDEEQTAYYEKLQDYIEANGLEQFVKLEKNLSRELVFEAYCAADIFVLPSTRERASIAQLEAMSCSLPVICSDTNGSACYVRNGVNGYLFREDDVDDLREKIACLINNRKLIPRMGQAGYRMVEEQYSFADYYEAIQAIKD